MKKNSQRGFTLIELLVVIAIIGILASVVLASLNTARGKGADANIKSNLANARAQAELYYSTNNTYLNVCTTAATSSGIQGIVAAAAKTAGIGTVGATTVAYTASPASAVCHDGASGWAAEVSLKNPVTAGAGWCVDSNGASKEEATPLAANILICT